MKNLFLFLFLVWDIPAKSQIAPEYFYPYENIKRVNLPGVGERYYGTKYDYIQKKGKIYWFNGDHQPIDTCNFNGPFSSFATPSVGVGKVSSDFFDADPGIEFEINWLSGSQGSGYGSGYAIRDDNGGALSPANIGNGGQYLVTAGGHKLVSGGKVYAIPGFVQEYVIPSNAFGYINLETGGGKFWYYKDNHLVLLNQNYSVYKDLEINLNSCDIYTITNLSFQGEHEINSDDKFEIFNYRSCGNVFQAQYYSENDLIFHFQDSIVSGKIDAVSLRPSNYPGLNGAKAWIMYKNPRLDSVAVYDVSSGMLEHKFAQPWTFMKSDVSGVKYLRADALKTDTILQVLNPDYSVWANFRKDTSVAISPVLLSETLFDGDASSKELLSRSTMASSYRWQITRPDGTILFELETPLETRLDITAGLQPKLICNQVSPLGDQSGISYVYDLPVALLPPLTPVEHEQVFRVQPNPFSDGFRLDFSRLSSPVDAIRIYSIQGNQLYEYQSIISDPIWEIPVRADWPQGLYLVRVYSGGTSLVQKAIRH